MLKPRGTQDRVSLPLCCGGGQQDVRTVHGTRPLLIALLMLLCLLTPPPAPTTAVDFDTVAASLGRADTWQLLHAAPATPSTILPSAGPASSSPALPTTVGELEGEDLAPRAYLPLITSAPVPITELRAVWVTRFDWTTLERTPRPEDVDTLVTNIASAGLNTIFFQIRAAGDAYYASDLEPWAARLTAGPVSTTLGVDPGWDPLAYMIERGHAAGLEVHAYVNVYPAWQSPPAGYGDLFPPATDPPQMFDRFTYGPHYEAHPGEHALGYTWRQYTAGSPPVPMAPSEGNYLWASPGVDLVNDHVLSVVTDIAERYAVDGIHLDLVRYAGPDYSYDPFSNAAAGTDPTAQRAQWQQERITGLVRRIYTTLSHVDTGDRSSMSVMGKSQERTLLSAAVWPSYTDGLTRYYQDSKGWLVTGALDAIVPMLYGSYADQPDNWQALMHDFLDDSQGHPVYPGIGVTEDFDAIAWRIRTAREAGAQGHALFSYGNLNAYGHWQALAAGPYLIPASPP